MNVARRLILCVATLCAAPAALGNHYILPCDGDCRDAGTPIQPGMTGAWGVPGQGTFDFIVEVLPGQPMVLSVAWLTFAPEGGLMWIVGRGPVNGNHATLTAYRGVVGGGRFPSSPDSSGSQVELWGTLQFTFGGCDFGYVAWMQTVGGYAAGETDVVRLTEPAGLTCTQGGAAQGAPGGAPPP